MDTSDQNSQEASDRHDTFTSECTPPGCAPGSSQYLRSDFRGRSSKICDAIKKSESGLSLHRSDDISQRDSGSQCAMEATGNELPRNINSKAGTVKSPTFSVSPLLNAEEARTVREKHNLKERKRR